MPEEEEKEPNLTTPTLDTNPYDEDREDLQFMPNPSNLTEVPASLMEPEHHTPSQFESLEVRKGALEGVVNNVLLGDRVRL